MAELQSFYEVLGVPVGAELAEIRKKYLALSLATHPDKAGAAGSDLFQRVGEAWRVLSDAELRHAYDETLELQQQRGVRLVETDVDLDSMASDGQGNYSLVCRCGTAVSICEADMSQGLDTIECSSCNLRFRILFTVMEEAQEFAATAEDG